MNSVVFDLDGTLADTSGDLIAAANACFQSLNGRDMLDAEADAITAFHGGRAMLRLGLKRLGEVDEAEVDRMYPILIDHYRDNIDVHTFLYDQVPETLGRLKGDGYLLGVCTNKPEALAEVLLQRLGIRDMFGAMLGADSLPWRKPDPRHLTETITRMGGRPDRAVLIGDTNNDRDAARNAAIPSVLVTFGPEGDRVSQMNPEALLSHYSDLPRVLTELGLS